MAALNAARHQAPGDPAVLTALATLHESLGRPEELADVLASLADSVRDEREWVTVQLRLASLLEDTLHRDPIAVQRYEAVLMRVPGHPAAWPDWTAPRQDAGLAGARRGVRRRAGRGGDPRTRAELHFRSSGDPRRAPRSTDEALARFREALQLVPGYLPASKA